VDERARIILAAFALTSFNGNLDAIPMVGTYLHAIVASIGAVTVGAALSSVLTGVWQRLKP
jgi:hypothetical protein